MKYWLLIFLCWLPAAFGVELIQNVDGRPHQLLDGHWSAIVDPFDVGDKRKFFNNARQSDPSELLEYNFSTAMKLKVPGDWNTQDDKLFLYEGSLWYQRDFSSPKHDEKNYVLYFGAVNYIAKVYLNGEYIGEHEGGFTPFQFDVTEVLKEGENSLVVKVNNRREPENIPPLNTDWWNYGGITRSVRLLELEPGFVSDYTVQYQTGDNPGIKASFRLSGEFTPGDTVKLLIPELKIEKAVKINADGEADIFVDANPQLWTPESPKLYETQIEYKSERITDRIGFRFVEVKGTEILLNGEPVFLRGVAIHEESPNGAGRVWSETEDRVLLGWAKELGSNYVRLAHYPHNEMMLRLADEMGLLVWAESPNYWAIQFDNEAVYMKAETQYTEMLLRDKNRASIILWSVANETPNTEVRTEFLSRLANRVRELDPTRLVTAAINTQSTTEHGRRMDDPIADKIDVIGINTYCGWYEDEPEACADYTWVSDYNKPIIISEFGAGALQGYHGSEDEIYTEEYQLRVFRNNLIMIENMDDLRGVSPWILKDFLSPRRPLANIQDYWNRKGLRSENGVKKQVWYLMQDWYRERAAQAATQ